MGELLSALCPSHYRRASEGVNKDVLKVLNRGLTCDSLPPLLWEHSNELTRLAFFEFFHDGCLYKLWFYSICTNMSQTAAFVWFILTILFGVFTNKHMQEVDNDWHYQGTQLYSIVGHGGCLQATWHQRVGGVGGRGCRSYCYSYTHTQKQKWKCRMCIRTDVLTLISALTAHTRTHTNHEPR